MKGTLQEALDAAREELKLKKREEKKIAMDDLIESISDSSLRKKSEPESEIKSSI